MMALARWQPTSSQTGHRELDAASRQKRTPAFAPHHGQPVRARDRLRRNCPFVESEPDAPGFVVGCHEWDGEEP
jgi:hypothetical protein